MFSDSFLIVQQVELVDKRLGTKIPTVKTLASFKTQCYVPTSNIGNRVDRGLYLMRHMETYKGKRAGYKSGLTDVSLIEYFP